MKTAQCVHRIGPVASLAALPDIYLMPRSRQKAGPAPGTDRLEQQAGASLPMPRLYLYVDAVIRHGSIRAAADSLGVASSALNRRVLDLERALGAPVFDRLSRGVRLTPAGELFAAHVRRVLDDFRQTGDAIQELQFSMQGHVAIGSAESAAIDVLPGLMADVQRAHPGIRFTLAVGTPRGLLEDLVQDRVDLILTHEEPDHHEVAVLATARKYFCALMRPGHPLAARQSLLMHECRDFPIVMAQENLAARALVDATLATSALSIRPVLVTNMFEVMKLYVRQTDAVSFQFYLPPLSQAPADGLAAVPLADERLARASLTLAARRDRVLSPSAMAVAEWLRKVVEA
jgi:DNA-binding transcriptional LysR family regulator